MSPYLVYALCMLGSRVANDNYIFFTQAVRTKADNKGRSSLDCSDQSQIDVGLPQTSFSTPKRHHVKNVSYKSFETFHM